MELYRTVSINGVEYCRAHLLLRCHLCELDFHDTQEAVEMEREDLELQPGGDARVDDFSAKWESKMEEYAFLLSLQRDMAGIQYGPRDLVEAAQEMTEQMKHRAVNERSLNDEFFADLKELRTKGASKCCYWACENHSSNKLLVCTGCKFHKYCCKEHQALDWTWEHRAECTVNVPQCVLDDMAAEMERHLSGDYRPRQSS